MTTGAWHAAQASRRLAAEWRRLLFSGGAVRQSVAYQPGGRIVCWKTQNMVGRRRKKITGLWGKIAALFALAAALAGCGGPLPSGHLDIGDRFAMGRFEAQRFTPEQVLDGAADDWMSPAAPRSLFGDAVSLYWHKAVLPAELFEEGKEYFIEIPYPLFDRVDLWMRGADGRVHHHRAGALYPFSERTVPVPDLVFPLGRPEGDVTVAFAVQTSTPLLTGKIFLWPREAWEAQQRKRQWWYGMLVGGITVLILYNLFLAAAFRDSSYLYYALYLASVNLINLIHAGYLDAWLWPGTPGVSAGIILGVLAVSIIAVMAFVNRFFEVRRHFPRWRRVSLVLGLLAIPPAFPDPLGYPEWNIVTIPVMLLLSHLSMWYAIAVAVLAYRRGMRQARFVILALVLFYLCILLYELYVLRVLDYAPWLPHVLEVGSLLEGIILSLALADRVNLLRAAVDRANRETMEARTAFSKRLIQAEEQYRERIAGLLHDAIAHSLLLIKHRLDALLARRADTLENGTAQEIAQQSRACGELLDEVRRLSHDLHPHLLTRLGLRAALEATLEKALSPRGICWQADIEEIDGQLDDARRILLYRAVQECLTNILKHAEAGEVMFSLRREGERVVVRIKDDGRGFDPAAIDADALGLATMKGRLALFGGGLKIDSAPGRGTHLILELPLRHD